MHSAVIAVGPSLRRLPFIARSVIEAMILTGGSIGTADRVAGLLGMRNRFELARRLKRFGLPPLHELASWVLVLHWAEEAECNGDSLCRQAFRSRKDPAACYRRVKRVTGLDWRVLRKRGLSWIVTQFFLRCLSRACIRRPHGTGTTNRARLRRAATLPPRLPLH